MRKGSAQRDCIVEFLRDNFSHPTAYEIYEAAKKRFPKVSLGTVYRNLDYLTQNQIVRKIQKAGTVERYDFIRERHNHAMCSECGKIFDFYFPLDAAAIQAAVGDKIMICDADFLISGICAECRKKMKRNHGLTVK